MKMKISDKELYDAADKERLNSYSPYSEITVGAALLCGSGKVYLGANIENSAYSPSVCAERVAFFKAVNAGEREFLSIAVAGGKRGETARREFAPCGVCRQVMAEFCNGDFEIIFGKDSKLRFAELLPYSFDEDCLK